MSTALLLVDLQYDFLERPGLLPAPGEFIACIERVLAHARGHNMPVIHIRTRVDPSGANRMPHWRERDIRECVAGTRGVEAPPELREQRDEIVIHKQFFSGFGNPRLAPLLAAAGIEELWVVGLYTHSCVRATVMDAYERGFRVTLVEDCLGSTDPLHAQLSLEYMDGRCARLRYAGELLGLETPPLVHHCPTRRSTVVAVVPCTPRAQILECVSRARQAGAAWRREPLAIRRGLLREFAARLQADTPQLLASMIADLGKPRTAALDELRRVGGHIDAALSLDDTTVMDDGTAVSFEPHGVVALVTPWNNAVAIAVGKLCAALLLGNSVVWKPAYQADNITRRLLSQLRAAGLPEYLVQVVNGGPREVRWLAQAPGIAAVSVTGPEQAGRALAPICQRTGAALQAELGGNNALLALADADLPALVPVWARLAFGFGGQRCTAIRRFVVERAVAAEFETRMRDATARLVLGHPEREDCEVGPLISVSQLQRVDGAVRSALARGARLITGGSAADAPGQGCYYAPTLLAGLPDDDPLVQEELFGPVAVVQLAEDFEHGLALVNGVRQGLLAGIATRSAARRVEFARRCDVGIVIDGDGLRIHPAAPFGGRKASQLGPPEHGLWDRQFFSRVKTCYLGESN